MEIGNIQIVAENMLEKSDEEKFIEFFKERYETEPNENLVKRYMDIISTDIDEQ